MGQIRALLQDRALLVASLPGCTAAMFNFNVLTDVPLHEPTAIRQRRQTGRPDNPSLEVLGERSTTSAIGGITILMLQRLL